jgi:hypothetical protein
MRQCGRKVHTFIHRYLQFGACALKCTEMLPCMIHTPAHSRTNPSPSQNVEIYADHSVAITHAKTQRYVLRRNVRYAEVEIPSTAHSKSVIRQKWKKLPLRQASAYAQACPERQSAHYRLWSTGVGNFLDII